MLPKPINAWKSYRVNSSASILRSLLVQFQILVAAALSSLPLTIKLERRGRVFRHSSFQNKNIYINIFILRELVITTSRPETYN
jgi:hypothetical protein